jgi:hypothetical protein
MCVCVRACCDINLILFHAVCIVFGGGGYMLTQSVQALRYKPEGRGFNIFIVI